MPKYLKPDCEQGFVEDTRDIEYLKLENMCHCIQDFMLGDFDDLGNYVLDERIKNELISMSKYLVESEDNMDICVSHLKLDKQISFLVTFEGERATLSLMERLNYEGNFQAQVGRYCNINEYILDVVETSGLIDRNLIYKKWNIKQYSGDALDVKDMDEQTLAAYLNIVNRYKYNLAASTVLLENEEALEEIEAEYASKMMAILAKYPKLKKLVEDEIKATLKDGESLIRLDSPNIAKTINEIINRTVEDNLDVLGEQKEDFLLEQREAKQKYTVDVQEKLNIEQVQVQPSKADINELNNNALKLKIRNAEKFSIQDLQTRYLTSKKKAQITAQNRFISSIKEPENISPFARVMKGVVNILGGAKLITNIAKETGEKLREVVSNLTGQELPKNKSQNKSQTKSAKPEKEQKKENKKKPAAKKKSPQNKKKEKSASVKPTKAPKEIIIKGSGRVPSRTATPATDEQQKLSLIGQRAVRGKAKAPTEEKTDLFGGAEIEKERNGHSFSRNTVDLGTPNNNNEEEFRILNR